MGLASNNVLHDRAGFAETAERRRLLYRARYYERISSGPYLVPAQLAIAETFRRAATGQESRYAAWLDHCQ